MPQPHLTPAVDASPPAHTLLIHGGSHGAWCWDDVIASLTDAGVSATAFDLPGCGRDQTPRDHLTLADSLATVIDHVDRSDGGTVRLVGHSIAGWLLPPTAAARPDRISELTFVAASVLSRGETGIDMTPISRRAGYYDLAAASPDNSLMLDFESAWARFFQHLPEPQARAAYSRLTPQPFGPYLEPARVGIEDVTTRRRYLAMSDDLTFPAESSESFAAKAGCDREVIEGDHCVMLTNPQSLVSALLGREPKQR